MIDDTATTPDDVSTTGAGSTTTPAKPKRKAKRKPGKPKAKKAKRSATKGAKKVAKKTTRKTTKKKAVKKGAKKPAQKAAKKAASTAPSASGQTGPKIDLAKEDLNKDEAKVYAALGKAPKTMGQLAKAAFNNRGRDGKVDPEIAFSRVRNAMRRLVRGRLVKPAGKIVDLTTNGVEMKRSAYRKAA